MLFRRKGWLRKEYDQLLLVQINELKRNWLNQKTLLEKCVEPTNEMVLEAKMAEVKYFSLFKEAKKRNVSVNKW